MKKTIHILLGFTLWYGHSYAMKEFTSIQRFNVMSSVEEQNELELLDYNCALLRKTGTINSDIFKDPHLTLLFNEDTFNHIKNKTRPFCVVHPNGKRSNIVSIVEKGTTRKLMMEGILRHQQRNNNNNNGLEYILAQEGDCYYIRPKHFKDYIPVQLKNPQLLQNIPDGMILGLSITSKESSTDYAALEITNIHITNPNELVNLSEVEQKKIKNIVDQLKDLFNNHYNFIAKGIVTIIIVGGIITLLTLYKS